MKISIECPTCGKTGTADDDRIGSVVKCKACGDSFRIGSTTTPPAPKRSVAKPPIFRQALSAIVRIGIACSILWGCLAVVVCFGTLHRIDASNSNQIAAWLTIATTQLAIPIGFFVALQCVALLIDIETHLRAIARRTTDPSDR